MAKSLLHTATLLVKLDDLTNNDKKGIDKLIESRIDQKEDVVAVTNFKYKVIGYVAPLSEEDSGCVVLLVNYKQYSKLPIK